MSKIPSFLDLQAGYEQPVAVRCIVPHPDDPKKILLVWRNDNGKQANMWEVTGGKKDDDMADTVSLKDIVRAEMGEEVGFEPDADHLHYFNAIAYIRGDTGQERPEAYFILDTRHYMQTIDALVGDNLEPGSAASQAAYRLVTGEAGCEHTHAAWVDIDDLGTEQNPIMRGSGEMFKAFLADYLAKVEELGLCAEMVTHPV